MTETDKKDPLAIRRSVLEAFNDEVKFAIKEYPEIWREVAYICHQKLCKMMGDDYINYPEFEFWFSRFSKQDFDLDYDISLQPKTRSFTDLPLIVFEEISKNLELDDRYSLRNVCKDIQILVDSSYPKITDFYYNTMYKWAVSGKSMEFSFYCKKNSKKTNPLPLVMRILKTRNLQLEELKIGETDEFWEKFIRELNESNLKFHVRKFELPCTRYRTPTKDLHYLMPGVLEYIELFITDPSFEEIHKIVESEQCKAAKMITFRSNAYPSKFPLECLLNCRRFTLHLGGQPCKKIKAKFIDNLLKSAQVELCHISIFQDIMRHFKIKEEFEKKYPIVDPNNPNIGRHKIPGTNEFYELEMTGGMMRIERKQ